jgi:hypothetical protein
MAPVDGAMCGPDMTGRKGVTRLKTILFQLTDINDYKKSRIFFLIYRFCYTFAAVKIPLL